MCAYVNLHKYICHKCAQCGATYLYSYTVIEKLYYFKNKNIRKIKLFVKAIQSSGRLHFSLFLIALCKNLPKWGSMKSVAFVVQKMLYNISYMQKVK